VATEFYTKRGNFPGFARPFAFNAKVLLKLGRNLEAKDAARGALKSSWWTLGCRYEVQFLDYRQAILVIEKRREKSVEHMKRVPRKLLK
jgi:hypothetical protein